ncbi:MAG: hypothetical protein U1D55_07425 [Phycisphaerae bacterium]
MLIRFILPLFDDWVLGRRYAPDWDRRTRILALVAALILGVWLGGATL